MTTVTVSPTRPPFAFPADDSEVMQATRIAAHNVSNRSIALHDSIQSVLLFLYHGGIDAERRAMLARTYLDSAEREWDELNAAFVELHAALHEKAEVEVEQPFVDIAAVSLVPADLTRVTGEC